MKKIKLGFIGVGFISQICHLPCFYHNKNTEIVAISDKNKELLDEVGKKYKIKRFYNDYNLMIKKEKLDAIVVVVERHFTAEILKNIIKHKIPIFTEKPPALTYNDAKILKNLALKYKTILNVGYMKIHDQGIVNLKKILSSKIIGSLESVIYFSHGGDSYCSPFMYHRIFKKKASLKNYLISNRIKNKKSYLNFINSQSHSINLIKHLFGKLDIKFREIKKNNSVTVIFNSKKVDILLDCKNSTSKKWEEKIIIFHSKGKIEIDFPAPQLANVPAKIKIHNYDDGSYLEPNIRWSWAFKEQADNFIKYIKKKNKSQYLPSDIVNCSEDIKLIENIFK